MTFPKVIVNHNDCRISELKKGKETKFLLSQADWIQLLNITKTDQMPVIMSM